VAVKIRLMRVGKKKQPSYRIVVADARDARDGRIIEAIGQYAPLHDPSLVNLDGERALHWLNNGAQPTESAAKILEVAGVWDAYKQANGKVAAAKPKPKTPKAKTVKEAPAPPAAETPAAETPAAETPAEEPATAEDAAEVAAEAAGEEVTEQA
jgi:small subunit ribosomal protein S16